jgi:hypothetical protein
MFCVSQTKGTHTECRTHKIDVQIVNLRLIDKWNKTSQGEPCLVCLSWKPLKTIKNRRCNLDDCAKISTCERSCILDKRLATKGRYAKCTDVQTVQALYEKLLLVCAEPRYHVAPEVLDKSEENDVQNLDWSVLVWIQICSEIDK